MMHRLDNHKNLKSIIVGTISFKDDILNEQKVQSINGKFNTKHIGECTIEIFANEGPIPHFHIYNKNGTFNTCVRIYENEYFSHGNKYRSKFNANQCRQLNEYLKQPYSEASNIISVWEYIEKFWSSNSNFDYPNKTKIQPHYENMRETRDEL